MLWFITLLLLALVAFFIIRTFKATAARRAAEQERLDEGSGLKGHLNHDSQASSESTESTTTDAGAHSNNSGVSETAQTSASTTSAGSLSSSAGIATAAATGAVGAAAASVMSSGQSASASVSGNDKGLNTGDSMSDAQEMIKILNLAESDAGRLGISREQFTALRSGDSAAKPSAGTVNDVAEKLRSMLA